MIVYQCDLCGKEMDYWLQVTVQPETTLYDISRIRPLACKKMYCEKCMKLIEDTVKELRGG